MCRDSPVSLGHVSLGNEACIIKTISKAYSCLLHDLCLSGALVFLPTNFLLPAHVSLSSSQGCFVGCCCKRESNPSTTGWRVKMNQRTVPCFPRSYFVSVE